MAGKSIFRYVQLVTELGIVIIATILVGLFFGMFIDSKLGTRGIFSIIFLIFGVIGGFTGAYKIIKRDL